MPKPLSQSLMRQEATVSSIKEEDCITLSANISSIFRRDPRILGFVAARHKFVSKIFEGMRVLEIGCQEGFGTLFVAPYVKEITSIDFFEPFIDGFRSKTLSHIPNCTLKYGDICENFIDGNYDGAFALDVLEHIDSKDEHLFWINISKSIKESGTVIVGMPSLESQVYASEASKIGHVNCKTGADLRQCALKYFKNVLIFSMNDEMLHNGFLPMSHYFLVVCTRKRASDL